MIGSAVILVDQVRRYPKGPHGFLDWCHMMSDDLSVAGLAELHAMAQAIGLPRRAFHWHARFPHYDLTPALRRIATVHGAAEVTAKDLVRRCRR